MKLNETYQLLVYVDDVSILGENRSTIKECASRKVGLEVNREN